MNALQDRNREFEVTAEIVLKAYACGVFPMAESAEEPDLFWIEPVRRGILPLDRFHVSRRLARTVRGARYDIRIDTDFNGVIDGCAQPAPGRAKTWINEKIRQLFGELFAQGHCHTVEAWQNERLVGGLYGLSLGGAFFGESMFAQARDASKVALVYLVARLRAGGYTLLDTQFVTEHLLMFGATEVSKTDYARALKAALRHTGDFLALSETADPTDVLALASNATPQPTPVPPFARGANLTLESRLAHILRHKY